MKGNRKAMMPKVNLNPTPRYGERVDALIKNSEAYHDAYYKAATFGGPSLYFHRRCVSMAEEPLSLQRLEFIYATLASWGMHRMGRGGSKMQSFESFSEKVLALADEVAHAAKISLHAPREEDWQCLKKLFLGIGIMKTGTSLIGNSKVMAHLLPHLVPPIDREYTLLYLRGNKNIRNNSETEWLLMKELLEGFFFPVARHAGFQALAGKWITNQHQYPWDTSVMKVVDNLVIGARKVGG